MVMEVSLQHNATNPACDHAAAGSRLTDSAPCLTRVHVRKMHATGVSRCLRRRCLMLGIRRAAAPRGWLSEARSVALAAPRLPHDTQSDWPISTGGGDAAR